MSHAEAATRRSNTPCINVALVKIASRCNLDCGYCYVYHAGDVSFRDRPRFMSSETLHLLVERVHEHCVRHDLRTFTFCLHGGEPLLAPRPLFKAFVEGARARLSGVDVRFVLQTNGVLLDAEWCSLLSALGVGVGVSVDGTPEAHDKSRTDTRGIGSYSAVLRGWKQAQRAGLSPNVLTVVDLATDPDAVFAHLAALGAGKVDLLLPAATFERPAAGAEPGTSPYGDWLLKFFRRWAAAEPSPFRVRMFDTIIAGVFGQGTGTDSLGSGYNGVVVVETDGALEPLDVLRTCRPGMTRTPLSVRESSLDEALDDPLVRQGYFSHVHLPAPCRRCPVRTICGGGYLPHRYSEARGFDNASVFCLDLLQLIAGIQGWVIGSLTPEVRAGTGLVPIDVERVRQLLAQPLTQSPTRLSRRFLSKPPTSTRRVPNGHLAQED